MCGTWPVGACPGGQSKEERRAEATDWVCRALAVPSNATVGGALWPVNDLLAQEPARRARRRSDSDAIDGVAPVRAGCETPKLVNGEEYCGCGDNLTPGDADRPPEESGKSKVGVRTMSSFSSDEPLLKSSMSICQSDSSSCMSLRSTAARGEQLASLPPLLLLLLSFSEDGTHCCSTKQLEGEFPEDGGVRGASLLQVLGSLRSGGKIDTTSGSSVSELLSTSWARSWARKLGSRPVLAAIAAITAKPRYAGLINGCLSATMGLVTCLLWFRRRASNARLLAVAAWETGSGCCCDAWAAIAARSWDCTELLVRVAVAGCNGELIIALEKVLSKEPVVDRQTDRRTCTTHGTAHTVQQS